tara:strand:- start:278 stop:1147 length:870 start_codon:yes stop_codon:yes gene_type:complete
MKIGTIAIRIVIITVFLLGLYFCLTPNLINKKEGLTPRCPNVLTQKGDKIELLNTGLAKIPGVNPIVFNNLEEYVEFTEWQRSRGITCPLLYLQEQYSTDGKLDLYAMNGNPMNPVVGNPPYDSLFTPPHAQVAPTEKLSDASKDDLPYNVNSFPGYDGTSQYQGVNTPLDKLFTAGERSGPKSANAMDTNWGGVTYARDVVATGLYDKRARKKINDGLITNEYTARAQKDMMLPTDSWSQSVGMTHADMDRHDNKVGIHARANMRGKNSKYHPSNIGDGGHGQYAIHS